MKSFIGKIKTFAPFVAALALALTFVAAPVALADVNEGVLGGVDSTNTDNTPDSLFGIGGEGGIFTDIVNVLLFIIGAVAVIMLIIGGIKYTVSNGDANAVTSAKNTILYAIIGIIVAILAYAVVRWVVGAFVE